METTFRFSELEDYSKEGIRRFVEATQCNFYERYNDAHFEDLDYLFEDLCPEGVEVEFTPLVDELGNKTPEDYILLTFRS